jgi:diguanylate cyclase (GGDEF)-like protein
LNISPFKPPHILFVDDQDSVLQYYQSVLSAAGMRVEITNNPLTVLDLLEAYRPDLIVLDVNMPLVSGDELAAVIRQHTEYQSIPILFFSNDNQLEQKTQLLEIGSDDLLHKGMPVGDLIRQIKSRVDRAKILSSFMYEDSLTGLFNHAQIQAYAEKAFSTAKRHKQQTCIAMLDLDNFKQINDSRGHQTGDKVLKALSQLLQQRLRSSDIIGRYGGEEFMLVLPNTSLNDAGILVNDLRKTFQNFEFVDSLQEFNVTFSAGIAESINCHSVTELILKADDALYRAKSSGKNKVCVNLQ